MRDLTLGGQRLAVCEKIGGPSVYPPQPDGVMALTRSVRTLADEQGRRSLSPWHVHVLLALDAPSVLAQCSTLLTASRPAPSAIGRILRCKP